MSKAKPFIIEVKTDNTGTSGSNQFTIPTTGTGYNYTVKTSEQTLSGQTGNVTLTWSSPGTYEVAIYGKFPRIFFNNAGDSLKLLKVKQWGTTRWSSFQVAFSGCSNLDVTATDSPNLSASSLSFSAIFQFCSSLLNSNGSISNWKTSNVTNMNACFSGCSVFNQDISGWNTSSVTNMQTMFQNATSFNQPIGIWNTSAVTTLSSTFNGATSFNQDISGWNTSNVTNLQQTFAVASAFNQDISGWNVNSATTMLNMFAGASAFNRDLSSWQLRLAGVILTSVFANSGMSTSNYTNTIVGWANYVQTNAGTPSNVSMATQNARTFQNSLSGGAGFATAGDARNYLTTATPTGAGWTISGDTVIP